MWDNGGAPKELMCSTLAGTRTRLVGVAVRPDGVVVVVVGEGVVVVELVSDARPVGHVCDGVVSARSTSPGTFGPPGEAEWWREFGDWLRASGCLPALPHEAVGACPWRGCSGAARRAASKSGTAFGVRDVGQPRGAVTAPRSSAGRIPRGR